jgi:CDP-diacylglycerol--glycerol-3-phosphate 3-phosphatidyltransferase
MRPANVLTGARLLLSPLFFIAFFLPDWSGRGALGATVAALVCYALIEITDLVDGSVARLTDSVSDFGKLLDPLADSVSRLTYFLCFGVAGFMPWWILLVLIYRDVSVAYIRTYAQRAGFTMAARLSGKLKAVVYGLAGAVGLLRLCLLRGLIPGPGPSIIGGVSLTAFLACAGIAVWSLIDYLIPVLKNRD